MQTRSNETRHDQRLTDVRLLDGGYCLQHEYLSGLRSLRVRRFHAMFLHFRHPTHGEAVIDTGYSPRFFEATRKLPSYLYRLATPVPRRQMTAPSRCFAGYPIEPEKVGTVFLSHFHADHIGGLCYYPNAKIVCDAEAIDRLRSLHVIKQLLAGFLRELLPNDFEQRTSPLDRSMFSSGGSLFSENDTLLEPFRVCDYWGDGSLLLVDLPGHAEGQVGFVLNTDSGRMFYVADAFWDIRVLRAGWKIPLFSRLIQHDWSAYLKTQKKLLVLDQAIEAAKLPMWLYASHCSSTQENGWFDAS
ncbi:MAG: MBL fold metallo-hydrolase [Planctomycetia bacterium]